MFDVRLAELVREVDPTEQLDEDVEEILLQIADDFIEQTVSQACALAKHRYRGNLSPFQRAQAFLGIAQNTIGFPCCLYWDRYLGILVLNQLGYLIEEAGSRSVLARKA
jgi:hypothetical protein